MKHREMFLLAALLVLTALLRFCSLGDLPQGFFCDEAATGYDAYSLALTGKDSRGSFFPLFLDHHGVDTVEPIYTYLTALPVLIAGPSHASVRFPAAAVGTLTVLLLYVFMKNRYGKGPAFWAALFLALSPWHIPFSRSAFRAVLVPFFTLLLLWLRDRGKGGTGGKILLSVAFATAFYTYTPVRVFYPAFAVLLCFFDRHEERNTPRLKSWILPAVLFLVLVIPIIISSLDKQGLNRFHDIGIFSREAPVSRFCANVAAHLHPRFLFTRGDPNGRHGIPETGVLHPMEGGFIVVFLLFLLRKKTWSHLLWPLLFLAALLPSALTVSGIPNALRSMTALPFPQIMAGLGVHFLLEKIRKPRVLETLLCVGVLLLSLAPMRAYFLKSPYLYAGKNAEGQYVFNWWQYGVKEAIDVCRSSSTGCDSVFFSAYLEQAYVFPLFYLPVPPGEHHARAGASPFTPLQDTSPDRLRELFFRSDNSCFILAPWELSGATPFHVITFPDGKAAWKIVVSPSVADTR